MKRVLCLAAFCAACCAAPPAPEEERAPTPFTADEIRASCPAGRVDRFLTVYADGRRLITETTFAGSTDAGAQFRMKLSNGEGEQQGEVERAFVPWTALRDHASFPAERTVITEAEKATPAGEFDCLLYVVTSERDGKPVERRMWFAKTLAGPPVVSEQWVDGKLDYRMTLESTKK